MIGEGYFLNTLKTIIKNVAKFENFDKYSDNLIKI